MLTPTAFDVAGQNRPDKVSVPTQRLYLLASALVLVALAAMFFFYGLTPTGASLSRGHVDPRVAIGLVAFFVAAAAVLLASRARTGERATRVAVSDRAVSFFYPSGKVREFPWRQRGNPMRIRAYWFTRSTGSVDKVTFCVSFGTLLTGEAYTAICARAREAGATVRMRTVRFPVRQEITEIEPVG